MRSEKEDVEEKRRRLTWVLQRAVRHEPRCSVGETWCVLALSRVNSPSACPARYVTLVVVGAAGGRHWGLSIVEMDAGQGRWIFCLRGTSSAMYRPHLVSVATLRCIFKKNSLFAILLSSPVSRSSTDERSYGGSTGESVGRRMFSSLGSFLQS